MAQDKRGQIPEPQIGDGLDDLPGVAGNSDDFAEGSNARNTIGDVKRAAAKATGLMGASKKLDPDLDISRADDGRIKSGSSAGIHNFGDVPVADGEEKIGLALSNKEVAEILPTTVIKSPAMRPEFAGGGAKPVAMEGGAGSRHRVPAPGTRIDVPKGKLVRKT